jgi:hypothetical protein
MQRKILAILVAFLAVIMLAAPAMATPKVASPAWHTIPASDTYYEVTYAQLTDMCLAAGLSENPYPTPTTPTNSLVPPFYHMYNVPAYYVFTITIGDEVYHGISCTVYDATMNVVNGDGQLVYTKATHYFGDLGDMNHGFDGACNLDIHGFLGTPGSYFIANWALQGFGHFTGQSLTLNQDSRTSQPGVATGSCVVLGNKWY